MTLYERYIGSEIIDLLRILENAQDYTIECIEVILEIMKDRNIAIDEIMDDILFVNREIIKKKLDDFNPLKEKVEFHKSQFLNKKEIEEIYKTELRKFIQKQDHFGFDVWSYAIGGL